MCLPRPDSPPIFGKILDSEGGHFSVELVSEKDPICVQRYIENTNILVTELESSDGSKIRITDFCPRFEQHGRMFRPMSLFRKVEAVVGVPRIRVNCVVVDGWHKNPVASVRGNSHLRFDVRDDSLRLVTNMSLTYLCEGTSFPLAETLYFGLTWSFSVEEDLPTMVERFLKHTKDYWIMWVKHCSIPSLFQKETIRSALALKLHCYEDTGAILAAITTSLPEELGGTRNWDYRYCWLRDSYFVLSAFHRLGHFEEMEGFLKFLLEIAYEQGVSKDSLAPVYTLSRDLPLPEHLHDRWSGYKESRPVRTHNQAAEHIQNDAYGEMILTLSPIFFDERFASLRSAEHERLLERLGRLAADAIGKPDAGLWEFRNGWREHSFTNLMSWAGLERLERIQSRGFLRDIAWSISEERLKAENALRRATLEGSLRNGPDDKTWDASLALVSVFRFPDSSLCQETVSQMLSRLSFGDPHSEFFFRYDRSDDFGSPQSAFVVCSFWMVQALVHLREFEKARFVLEGTLRAANHLDLYSEHFDPKNGLQLGNFPQAYSHVGLINAAFSVSPPWADVL